MTAAAIVSMTLSSPNPSNAMLSASAPDHNATTASMTLYAIVVATSQRAMRGQSRLVVVPPSLSLSLCIAVASVRSMSDVLIAGFLGNVRRASFLAFCLGVFAILSRRSAEEEGEDG